MLIIRHSLILGPSFSLFNFNLQKHMKLICAALSLPSPPDRGKEANGDINGVSSNHDEQRMLHKLLLVGSDESGTSTIYKQVQDN